MANFVSLFVLQKQIDNLMMSQNKKTDYYSFKVFVYLYYANIRRKELDK